ncbi:alpha/beta hydrolase [Nafulsella turpanensis]|uniref:alpha/beta hydrolase n=1 Tax=Nafulsella turpanensis TaxID=1265690 RepID=UPI0003790D31|nr:alpha/beta hydrolase [Nafulsella turpanensis]
MEAQQQSIFTQFQARYFTLGKLNMQTPAVWLVCHGYGQLASYFIRHFQSLADAGHYVIAPEGLSRFYLEGFSGRVGATWMTKEDRQSDIDNYVRYLSAVYAAATKEHPSRPLHLLGFSQGVATISRWAALSGQAFKELVLWAGVFPPDLPVELSAAGLKDSRISIVYGTEDPYIKENHLQEQKQVFSKMGLQPSIISFPGKHEISGEILKTYFTH